jgi:hypothetical protein
MYEKPLRAGLVKRFRDWFYWGKLVQMSTSGSNPAHEDAKRKDAATQRAEVFALP